jgi:hypothetical protein
MWDRAGPIRGLWRILDGKGECDLMSDLELWGGSPRPCRLRIDRLASVSKLDYLLAHTGFVGSRKLSNFGSHRVGRSLTSPTVMYIGIMYMPPTDSPSCGVTWKRCTRERWDLAWLFDHCRKLWPLMVPLWLTCVVLLGYLPCKVRINLSLRETLGYGWYLLVAVISCKCHFTYVHMRFMLTFNYDYLVV